MRTRAHTNRHCATCGSSDVIAVSLNMEDGGVGFWACSMCEATGWERGGSMLSRTDALSRIPRR